MLMLGGARQVSRVDLASIATPRKTASWKPLRHKLVADTVIARAEKAGLTVRNERWAVMDGALYPEPGARVDVPSGRLFGTVDFERVEGIDLPDGLTPSIGIRHANDKTLALSVMAGARVFVCANGVFSGSEYVVSRRHTSQIDLKQEVDAALEAFLDSVRGLGGLVGCLQARRLTPRTAHSVVIEAAKAGAYASSHILDVVRAYEEPEHREFKPRTGWSLYNACTSVMKRQSPARQVDGLKALSSVFISRAN